MGPEDGREHSLAHADSRARSFEPNRLGRQNLPDDGLQQRPEGDLPPRSVRRRRCVNRSLAASMDALCARQANRQGPVGARRSPGRASREAPHQIDLRQLDARNRRAHSRGVVRVARRLCLRRQRALSLEGGTGPTRSWRIRHTDVRVGSRQLAHHLEQSRHPAVRHTE